MWREVVTTPAFLVFAALSWAAVAAQYAGRPGGIIVRALSWYTAAAYLVFPFVAIASVAKEKARGTTAPARIVLLFAVLSLAWMVGWIPGLVWLGVWQAFGGRLYAPDVLAVLLQHLLRGVLAIGTFAALGVILASAIFGFSLGAFFCGAMILLMAGKPIDAYLRKKGQEVFEPGTIR